jgi:hypothetical protein
VWVFFSGSQNGFERISAPKMTQKRIAFGARRRKRKNVIRSSRLERIECPGVPKVIKKVSFFADTFRTGPLSVFSKICVSFLELVGHQMSNVFVNL